MHSYESVLSASIHELAHAYNYQLNPNMSYWLNNGLAGFLSGQEPSHDWLDQVPIPTLKDTRIKGLLAPIKFAGFGGYEYSYLYFEYLDSAYSWEEIVRLAKTGNYFDSLGVSEEEVYQAWVHYLSHK